MARFFQYVKGYLYIRVTGFSTERFLNLCSNKRIDLWGLTPKKNCYEMYIEVKGFKQLKPILKKTGTKATILRRFGLPFFLQKYKKRKAFTWGLLSSVLLVYGLSLFLWDINIEGNLKITDKTILEFLNQKQVTLGMRKSKLQCEAIEKNIRKQFDDIVWVSASIKGSRLFVRVKENPNSVNQSNAKNTPTNIVASKKGTIVNMITRQGVPLVQEGSKVKKGDVLVSGAVPVCNDAGEVVKYREAKADADIFAKTKISYQEEMKFTQMKKEYTERSRTSYVLRIGSLRIALGLGRNIYDKREMYTIVKQVKLGEQFSLPIYFEKKVLKEYKMTKYRCSKAEVQKELSEGYNLFCKQLDEDDATVLKSNVKIYMDSEKGVAKGTIDIVEDIGKQPPAQ